MTPPIEFTIERFKRDGALALIDGRVCESPIKLGDVFTKIRSQKQRWDGTQWIPEETEHSFGVRLEIQSIESYRRQWEELSPGMTARLTIFGNGLDQLAEGLILAG